MDQVRREEETMMKRKVELIALTLTIAIMLAAMTS